MGPPGICYHKIRHAAQEAPRTLVFPEAGGSVCLSTGQLCPEEGPEILHPPAMQKQRETKQG